MDATLAGLIGQAVSDSEAGGKVGIVTDSSVFSKAVACCVKGGLTARGSRVWDFGEGFGAQIEYYVLFCGLKSGAFLSATTMEKYL